MSSSSSDGDDGAGDHSIPEAHSGGTYFLGRYRVVDEIGIGGMASVHLARMDGPGGFQKWVAIKKIHPHLVEDETFVQMFLDEARVAARISHPNVATVFDLGKHDDTYWIAMEYLHGEPLREVMRRTEELGTAMPPEIACRVIADAAEGLHAAHELLGKNGEKLGLVHRDVTPHNLFVTYDGVTKVVDFGIAKFSSRMSHTRAGTLKGKLAYMSPEQVHGEGIDRRTDIFALGVVLWELTTGQRLFRMESDLDTLAKVQECNVARPSTLIRGYPVDLEKIVMKALAKNRGERFRTARELSRALQSLLMRRGLFIASDEVAAYTQSVFADRIQKREAHLRWAAEVTQTINIDKLLAKPVISKPGAEFTGSDVQPSSPTGNPPAMPPRPAAGMPAPPSAVDSGKDVASITSPRQQLQRPVGAPRPAAGAPAPPSNQFADSYNSVPEPATLNGLPARSGDIEPEEFDEEDGDETIVAGRDGNNAYPVLPPPHQRNLNAPLPPGPVPLPPRPPAQRFAAPSPQQQAAVPTYPLAPPMAPPSPPSSGYGPQNYPTSEVSFADPMGMSGHSMHQQPMSQGARGPMHMGPPSCGMFGHQQHHDSNEYGLAPDGYGRQPNQTGPHPEVIARQLPPGGRLAPTVPRMLENRTVTAERFKRRPPMWVVAALSCSIALLFAAVGIAIISTTSGSSQGARGAGTNATAAGAHGPFYSARSAFNQVTNPPPAITPPPAASSAHVEPSPTPTSSVAAVAPPASTSAGLLVPPPQPTPTPAPAPRPAIVPTPTPKKPSAMGALTVICTPKCDQINDNGSPLGPGHIFNRPVPAGKHTLVLSAAGKTKSLMIDVAPEKTSEVRIPMQ